MSGLFTNALIGWPVHDGLRSRLGHLATLYVDVADDDLTHPASGPAGEVDAVSFGGVAMLRRGRRRIVFVSLSGASLESGRITLACGGELVRRAPNVQAGHPLPVEVEPVLFAHYGLRYVPLSDGGRRLIPLR